MKPSEIGIDPEYFMAHAKLLETDDKGRKFGKVYWISGNGIVYNQSDNNFLVPLPEYYKDGRIKCLRIWLTRSNSMAYPYRVHRLVAMMWVPLTDACIISYINECVASGLKPDCGNIFQYLDVHHNNQDKTDNFYLNLCWKAKNQHRQLHAYRRESGVDAFIKANGRRYRNLVDDISDRDNLPKTDEGDIEEAS